MTAALAIQPTASEAYIPSARDAVIAYFGRNSTGLRLHCVACRDSNPLTREQKVYGDDYYVSDDGPQDRAEGEDCCDVCGVTLRSLSVQCQREHDEQQARFARGRVDVVIEYGMPSAVRCRVY